MTTMVLDTMELSNKEIVAYVILAVLLVLVVLYFATDSYLVPPLLLSNIGLAILYNFGSNIMLG
jgi:predicted RND superfamily exporter protein